jgi:hypothetical protein
MDSTFGPFLGLGCSGRVELQHLMSTTCSQSGELFMGIWLAILVVSALSSTVLTVAACMLSSRRNQALDGVSLVISPEEPAICGEVTQVLAHE